MTEASAVTLQNYALSSNDNPRLTAAVSGMDWTKIIPQDLVYHKSCYSNLIRKSRKKVSDDDATFFKLTDFVKEKVIENSEVIKTTEIFDYLEEIEEGGLKNDKRTVLNKIMSHFGDSVALWSPKYGSSFMYNNKIEKGEIVDIMFKKIERLKDTFILTFEDQSNNVSSKIREEILNMEPTYSDWPPNEDELIENKCRIPSSLETLIGSIISADQKRVKN